MDAELIRSVLTDYLRERKIELINLSVSADNVVCIDLDSFEGVDLDRCVEVSKYFESKFSRDEEDYELQVGSVSLTDPFVTPMQYKKHIGHDVTVLTKDGRKLCGQLVDADDEKFMVDAEIMVREEGAKRKKKQIQTLTFGYGDVKSVKYNLKF